MEPSLWLGCGTEGFDGPTPTEIVVKILGGDSMEGAQPLFEPTVVAIDVIDVEGGRFRSWTTGRGQDMAGNLRFSGEANDRFAAIAAQLVGRSDNAIKGSAD